jgi:hypothetical protein
MSGAINPPACDVHEQSCGRFSTQQAAVAVLSNNGGRAMSPRTRLPNRRATETFDLDVAGLIYTATFSRSAESGIGEFFLNNQKSNSQADANARDSAIAFSFAVQHGADAEAIRCALSRDDQGRALGPLGAALDCIHHIAEQEPIP